MILKWSEFNFFDWIPTLIRFQSVRDENWQVIRKSMLKTDLKFKHQTLQKWLEKNKYSQKSKVQAQNYVQALRRSGLIEQFGRDDQNMKSVILITLGIIFGSVIVITIVANSTFDDYVSERDQRNLQYSLNDCKVLFVEGYERDDCFEKSINALGTDRQKQQWNRDFTTLRFQE